MTMLAAALSVVAALAGPARAGEAPEVVTLPGWFRVTVPAGFTMRSSGSGAAIEEEGSLRAPLQVRFIQGRFHSVLIGPERATPAGPARWAVTKLDGGSGGPEWQLRIDHPLVTVVATQQREDGEPDFARVWAIVDTIEAAPAE